MAEGYTGSRACNNALLELAGTEQVHGHHTTWPYLKSSETEDTSKLLTFSFVRHPCDIIATQVAKGSRHTVPTWLVRRYRRRRHDAFFCHRSKLTLFYEDGLKNELEKVVQQPVNLQHLFPTPGKIPWKEQFEADDFKFACATIPELFTLGYVDWMLRQPVKQEFLDYYLNKHWSE
jgi:hypothetical protein